MFKFSKILFFLVLILSLLISFFWIDIDQNTNLDSKNNKEKPKVALIFNNLGDSLQDFYQIYELKIPVTLSVIPGLRFSKNIAHVGTRAGFPILIHLPLEPKEKHSYQEKKYDFISNRLAPNQINRLLNNYLNSIRIAIGVSTHLGQKATQDPELMRYLLTRIKQRNLIFIDSRTTPKSVAYQIAKEKNIDSSYSRGHLSGQIDFSLLKEKINKSTSDDLGDKLILIVEPDQNIFDFFEKNLTKIKELADFITITEYFELK